MKVVYCDACGCPIKGYKFQLWWYRAIENPRQEEETKWKESVKSANEIIEEDRQEICENCSQILRDFFKARMYYNCDVSETLRKMFEGDKNV